MTDAPGLTIDCKVCKRTWFVPGDKLDTWYHVWMHLRAGLHWHDWRSR